MWLRFLYSWFFCSGGVLISLHKQFNRTKNLFTFASLFLFRETVTEIYNCIVRHNFLQRQENEKM